jgi:hypothetical protein
MSMRFSLLAASAVLALATTAAYAAPQATSSAGHSTKLGDCSHAAKGKTGADYKSAVDACMKGSTSAPSAPASTKKLTSQEQMAECSHAAKGKKGADYKNAVSACMKSH